MPSTEFDDTSTLSQALSTWPSISLIPLRQEPEQRCPAEKSAVVQPVIVAWYTRLHAIGSTPSWIGCRSLRDTADAVDISTASLLSRTLRHRLVCDALAILQSVPGLPIPSQIFNFLGSKVQCRRQCHSNGEMWDRSKPFSQSYLGSSGRGAERNLVCVRTSSSSSGGEAVLWPYFDGEDEETRFGVYVVRMHAISGLIFWGEGFVLNRRPSAKTITVDLGRILLNQRPRLTSRLQCRQVAA